MIEVKRTERGWAGHYICSADCLFRRNTLLEYGDKKWIISTVGCQFVRNEVLPVGYQRWYETMAFEATDNDGYLDADVTKQIQFTNDWSIYGKNWTDVLEKYNNHHDLAANDMHEKVVEELMEKIKES